MIARRATAADSANLHAWRNDPLTRSWSVRTAEVPLADHEPWLAATLANPDRLLLVIEHEDRPVAVVRFDRLDPGDLAHEPTLRRTGAHEVNITVAPAERGRGLGGSVLAAAEEALPPGEAVLARVHSDNTASLRLFRGAGYRPDPAFPRDGVFEFLLKRR